MLCFIIANAQDASYIYKPLAKEGCQVEYSAIKQDNKCFIVVSVRSDEGLCFISEPVMMLRTGNDVVIKLNGVNIGTRNKKTSGTIVGQSVLTTSAIISMAQFELTDEQVEALNSGVSKIRLTTTPFIHERVFNKDKIGRKLYKAFCKQTNTSF